MRDTANGKLLLHFAVPRSLLKITLVYAAQSSNPNVQKFAACTILTVKTMYRAGLGAAMC